MSTGDQATAAPADAVPPRPTGAIAVAVYDEPELVVAGVTAMLGRAGSGTLVRRLVDGRATGSIDVVLCDPVNRDVGLEDYLAHLGALTDAPVLVFTWQLQPAGVRRVLAAGAGGVLSKSATATELGAAVGAVHRGEPLDDALASFDGEPTLSARETQVLALICRGLSNLEIADELYVSVNSVKTYIRQVYQKIDVARRSQAVAWGIARGY